MLVNADRDSVDAGHVETQMIITNDMLKKAPHFQCQINSVHLL